MASTVEQLKAKFAGDINITKAEDTETSDVTGLCVLSETKLVVADGNTMKLIDLESDQRSTFQMDMTAWDVTKVSDNKVIVTLPFDKEIKQLTIDKSGEFIVDHETKVSELCYGVQYCENCLIISHYGTNSRIEILDMASNTVLKSYESDETVDRIIQRPEYIALNTESGIIYISDWMNQTVTSMTLEGKVIATATDFEEPKGITTNKNGNVFVCEYASNKIYAMSSDLSESKVLLDSTHGINAPQCIAFSETTNQLFVGQENINVIKVFDIIM